MPYLGELRAFRSELPRGWLPCDGRLLEIRYHPALFSLIGDGYGGDSQTTFAVPDLRGRATAGADFRRSQHPGATSGRTDDDGDDREIPYHVVRWGIASEGYFPSRHRA
jgi:microcystin-dependent protein